jgi:hypothetical protein
MCDAVIVAAARTALGRRNGVLSGTHPVDLSAQLLRALAELTAAIPATRKAVQRSGLSLSEIGAFEVNEALAPVPLAWLAETGADAKILNPNCGAIAPGQPLGGGGARLRPRSSPHAGQRHPLWAADHMRGWRAGQRHHSGAVVRPAISHRTVRSRNGRNALRPVQGNNNKCDLA